MLLLKQNTIKKKQIDKNETKLNAGNDSKGYKVEAICNSAVNAKESKSDNLPNLYYLIPWKDYIEEGNT